jgi:CIC family chloride channel protein
MRERRLLLDALILGVAGALAALVFTELLHLVQFVFLRGLAGYQAPGLPAEGGVLRELTSPSAVWRIPIATTLGGLLVGYVVYRWAPEAEGHGTDTVVGAFHRAGGFLRARVPPIKLVASALTIGSGGSAGREGPVALVAAGIGSVYARWTDRNEDDTRLLLLIGMAAGLSAIFRSPIGTALFAVEVLYRGMDFEADALLFTTISSVTAYALSGVFLGWQALFRIPPNLVAPNAIQYGWYALLGVAGGIVGSGLPLVFYKTRDLFRKLPIPPFLKPALGGLAVGLIAIVLPQVLGGGYGWIQEAIDGSLTVPILLALLVAKPLALSLTIGSGGSGGVFAPSLYIGAMLGGVLAAWFHQPAAAFVVVGMAAVFGSAARVPFATLMMVIEMTGGYTLLVPAGLAVVLSYLVQFALVQKRPIRFRTLYEQQVQNRADSPAHHTEHLRIALRILEQHRQPLPANIGRLSLVGLLRSGIPVDLPGDRRLTVATVPPNSPLVGHAADGQRRLNDAAEVIGILRGERMLPPRPDLGLEAGDRLILVMAPTDWPKLEGALTPGWT